MSDLLPHVREVGNGPGVVCIHANASTGSQWRDLMQMLSATHRVLAPDCYGSGRSPQWTPPRAMTLGDEASLMRPVFTRAGLPCALVGHSYGAAVALVAALEQPRSVRALALYEPTLFALVDADHAPPNEADGIRHTVAAACAALDTQERDRAAELFVDFWAGAGTWAGTSPARKSAIVESIGNIPHWAHALFHERRNLEAFRALDMPILYMLGARSPASSRAVARILAPALPRVRVVEFDALGHMGPVTHPQLVNETIATFLRSN